MKYSGSVELDTEKLSRAKEPFDVLVIKDYFKEGTDILVHEKLEQAAREVVQAKDQLILDHFETDLSELREYLDAKRAGQTLKRVIPCQNCVYWSPCENSIQGRCEHHGIYPTGAWFCGDAMLKEGES